MPTDMDANDPTAYHNAVPELAGVYLEDSFVIRLQATEDSLVFDIDVVLTPAHPEYRDPLPNEVHCYRNARITIDGARAIQRSKVRMLPTLDPDGTVDLGSIDMDC